MKRRLFTFVFLCAVFSMNQYAQVTIGSSAPPNPGAFLDVKQNNNTDANSTKGIGMPRVFLHSFTGDLAETLGHTSGSLNANDHIGLFIYNTANCVDGTRNSKGLHVWNGTKWKSLVGYADPVWTGGTVTGKSGYKYKFSNFGTAGDWLIEDLKETTYDTAEDANPILTRHVHTTPGTDDPTYRAYYFPSPNQPTGNITNDRVWYDNYQARGIGLYYSWGAATNGKHTENFATVPNHSTKTSYVQGLCPNGWVVPSDYDQTVLEKEIITSYQLYSSANQPQAWNPDWWENDKNPESHRPRGSHSTNMKTSCVTPGYLNPSKGTSLSKGYNVMLSGYIDASGVLVYPGSNSHHWSSSAVTSNRAYYRYFNSTSPGYSDEGVGRYPNKMSYMFSLRCKRSPNALIGTVRGISGKIYFTGNFDAAGVWMIENLDETRYDDGTSDVLVSEPILSNDYTTRAYTFPNNVNSVNNPTTDRQWYDKNKDQSVGLLYSWIAASKGVANDNLPSFTGGTTKSTVQGICPKGWVLPSDYDMALLEKEVIENPSKYGNNVPGSTTVPAGFNNRNNVQAQHGANMKRPAKVVDPANNVATNGEAKVNGFNMVMVGYLNNRTTNLNGSNMHFWSSTTYQGGTRAFYRYANSAEQGLGRFSNEKSLMFSVRCKKSGT